MNRCIIYCTEEQTRKALELGATFKKGVVNALNLDKPHLFVDTENPTHWNNKLVYWCPTVEEIINWLKNLKIIPLISQKTN